MIYCKNCKAYHETTLACMRPPITIANTGDNPNTPYVPPMPNSEPPLGQEIIADLKKAREEQEVQLLAMPLTIHGVSYETIARDLFIAAAIAGFMANPATPDIDTKELGEHVVTLADAVMKARTR